MSRIGKQKIQIPDGVTIDINNSIVTAKGPLGEEKVTLLNGIEAKLDNNELSILAENTETDKKMASLWGLFRSLLNNIVIGVTTGFEKDLEIIGVGYRATQQNKDILFQLGFSHNITFPAPEGITLQVLEATKIKVKGTNKQQVGQVAANIRKLRPPEPYKGKGIRYKDEYVRKKAGKAGK
ncbi:50S ribosomal protein L6 [Candidatus Woesearchaeota archaeon]|nr:50S ribosomal protein L6 [Candidatus Woesearchaeota archaeon]